MDEPTARLLAAARERFPEHVGEPAEEFGEWSVDVAREVLVEVARSLRARFEILLDWSAVDYLGIRPPEQRFLLAAHLGSVRHPERLRLRVWIPEDDVRCASLTPVWPGADFMEREMFDFFGVRFDGHPDLRRIFMPEEWEGHPQRKDYPLGGVNVPFHHGAFIPPPETRGQPATTTGYPGRLS